MTRFDPKLASRSAGLLLELLQRDFGGDLVAKMESFEKSVSQYQSNSNEVLSDAMRIGIVLNRLGDSDLTAHLLFNSARLTAWRAFRDEIINACKARAASAGRFGNLSQHRDDVGVKPMDVGALHAGWKGGGKGDRDRKGGKGGWKGGKGDKDHKGGGKGGKGAKGDTSQRECWRRGKIDFQT